MKRWIVLIAVAGILIPACFFSLLMWISLTGPALPEPPYFRALLEQPIVDLPEASVRLSSPANAADGGTSITKPSPTLFPADKLELAAFHQSMVSQRKSWHEASSKSLVLNTRLVPLDSNRPLLPLKGEYDESQRKLAQEINFLFASIQKDLMQFDMSRRQNTAPDELFDLLRRIEKATWDLGAKSDLLNLRPLPDKVHEDYTEKRSQFTDRYTYELLQQAQFEIRRYTSDMTKRLSHDHERWDLLLRFTEREDRIIYIRRMNGSERFRQLAGWTYENRVQLPIANWFDRILGPNFFGTAPRQAHSISWEQD